MNSDTERRAIERAIEDVEVSLLVLAKLARGNTEMPSYTAMSLALAVNDGKQDDTAGANVLAAVCDLLLTQDRRGSADRLHRVVHLLETVVDMAYVPVDLPENATKAIDLNTAGERSIVRPEDVPEELRKVTIQWWQDQHTRLAREHLKIPAGKEPAVEVTQQMVDDARRLVDEARAVGAFLIQFDEMPEGQQLFWLQRGAGVERDMNGVMRPRRGPPPSG